MNLKAFEKAFLKSFMEIVKNPESLKHRNINEAIDETLDKFQENLKKEEEVDGSASKKVIKENE